ncbi:putative membrane protein (TIGR02234 family) [Homoserinimonas aerilata]|uniref:Putative membrane protein (TIGR02234 family) n=1 Tax=Homoserinimonas aerilata TaxID=1162970 RepID=A0A542YIU0_9MICO|nr:Trp biosynthesis-associated membrane protein [Homoserinimonas aerilata]TQL47992.1 putative membrane protein (TIGR02234 family) [Homoserinimonas aerilata]
MRRIKSSSLIAGVLFAGLGLMAWTMPWFLVTLGGSESHRDVIEVTGETAAPAVAALSLSALALVAALAIAGPFFRIVLAVLEALIGACLILSGVLALAAPAAAVAPLITDATGIDGAESLAAVTTAIETTPWPAVAVIAGGLMVALGVVVLATATRWPVSGRKYQATRFESADAPRGAVSDWDSLSDGEDPTGEPDAR